MGSKGAGLHSCRLLGLEGILISSCSILLLSPLHHVLPLLLSAQGRRGWGRTRRLLAGGGRPLLSLDLSCFGFFTLLLLSCSLFFGFAFFPCLLCLFAGFLVSLPLSICLLFGFSLSLLLGFIICLLLGLLFSLLLGLSLCLLLALCTRDKALPTKTVSEWLVDIHCLVSLFQAIHTGVSHKSMTHTGNLLTGQTQTLGSSGQ